MSWNRVTKDVSSLRTSRVCPVKITSIVIVEADSLKYGEEELGAQRIPQVVLDSSE